MKFVTVTELRLNIKKIISKVEKENESVVITRKGKPVAIIRPIEEGSFEYKNHLNNLNGRR